jgi:hypothetical protein
VLAFNVQAVTRTSVDWAQAAWTFPVITLISCMPFTVAGAGVREVAALGVPGPLRRERGGMRGRVAAHIFS